MAPSAPDEKNALTPHFLYGVKKGVNGGLNFLGNFFEFSIKIKNNSFH